MATVKLKTNDTYPPVQAKVKSEVTSDPISLTGATITFHMKSVSGTVVVSESATITNASDGEFEYNWAAADTANAGHYYAEFEITLTGGEVFSVPTGEEYIDIIIGDDID